MLGEKKLKYARQCMETKLISSVKEHGFEILPGTPASGEAYKGLLQYELIHSVVYPYICLIEFRFDMGRLSQLALRGAIVLNDFEIQSISSIGDNRHSERYLNIMPATFVKYKYLFQVADVPIAFLPGYSRLFRVEKGKDFYSSI